MVRRNTALILGVVLAAGIPVAGASSDSCTPSTDPNAIEVDGMYYVQERLSDGYFYVVVYAETNGLAGLQTGWTPCGYGQPMVRPDTQVATLSRLL